MGKTAFCLNIAAHAAIRARFNAKKIGVAIFSLEMPSVQLVMRMLASERKAPDAQRLRTGRLIESDWPKLAHAAGQLAEAVMHIDDSPGLTALDLRAKCRRLAAKLANSEAPLGMIIIDYLQLMKGNERDRLARAADQRDLALASKASPEELKIPVMALSQLNRSLEKRPDKRPIMSDLRESGAIEQDADTICFLYREEVYEKDNENVKGVAEVIIGKQRNGHDRGRQRRLPPRVHPLRKPSLATTSPRAAISFRSLVDSCRIVARYARIWRGHERPMSAR